MSLNVLAIPLTYLDFKLRQDYYANVLCQNQDQPIAVCGGRCFVDKQVAMMQAEAPSSSDANLPAPTLEIDLSVYVVVQLLHLSSDQYLSESSIHLDRFVFFSSGYPVSIFHPPQG
ncbi:hypothetical protein [Tunicatimonas pelagia]|uniref:hypothetical protein n=1 Tax=Tunicatimonas pelagia TaxID=931531 RepID=UPI0026662F20|nr:hypothetical protein [Tunicatimonas pelagia]WKN41902.1 hypothetical protein P0M28_22945 [Tunicatimonas pelagia]